MLYIYIYRQRKRERNYTIETKMSCGPSQNAYVSDKSRNYCH